GASSRPEGGVGSRRSNAICQGRIAPMRLNASMKQHRPSARSSARLVRVVPGVVASASLMLLALPIADWAGKWLLQLQGVDPEVGASPISGVTVAIVLGLLVRNLFALPESLRPGIQFS